MSHEETDYEPEGACHTYRGWKVTDHGVHADDINHGQQDPDWKRDEESQSED